MSTLSLSVLSLRYSSWSIRAWLALRHAGAEFETKIVTLDDMGTATPTELRERRRQLGSVAGYFPVLRVDDVAIHEALAIGEWTAEAYPEAGLWPAATLDRARARAVACEMAAGFPNLRSNLSCHVFARVPGFTPNAATQAEIDRVFELWSECLARSGGPFLFGGFGIADAMYFPVLTRFRTYGIALPSELVEYAAALETQPAVTAWREAAIGAPRIPQYDRYIRELGGDPDGGLA
jgi:glutathione S-transferase